MSDDRQERPGFLKQKPIDYPEIPCKIKTPKGKDRLETGIEWLDKVANNRRLYQDLQRYREERWHELVDAFEANPDFYNAYQWLQHHPLFYWFMPGRDGEVRVHERWLIDERGLADSGLEITAHRVDPVTGAVSNDPMRNTRVEFWYEVCITKWGQPGTERVHDYKRDGGARSYEEAIVQAAKHIHRKYGNGRSKFDKSREPKP